MGMEHKGERMAGVLYDPTRDELFAAEKGSGAYLNGDAHERLEGQQSWRKR